MHNHMKRVTMTATDFCSDCIDQSQQISILIMNQCLTC